MYTALLPARGFYTRVAFATVTLAILLFGTPASASPFSTRTNDINVQVGQSIQAAIDAASPGSTITISPGIYIEQLTINTDGISLIGEGAIIIPPATPIENTCSGLAGNSTNAGICIAGSGIELAPYVTEHRKLLSVTQPVRDISITGLEVWNSTGENIAVVGGENVQILNNAAYNGKTYGILSVGSSNVIIANNTVVTEESINFIAICTDNIVVNTNTAGPTQVLQNRISGYYIGLCIQTPGSLISSNDVSSCCVGAFVDPGVTSANVINNHIADTNPICAAVSPSNAGIIIDGAQNAIVHSNFVTGQKANGTAAGIILVDAHEVDPPVIANGNSVAFNVLTGNDFDVFVNSTGSGNVLAGNVCESSGEGCN